jgi:O-antigen/teichoic acid export membrane protein
MSKGSSERPARSTQKLRTRQPNWWVTRACRIGSSEVARDDESRIEAGSSSSSLRNLTRYAFGQVREHFSAIAIFLMRGSSAFLSYSMFALIGHRCTVTEYGAFAIIFTLTGLFGPLAAVAQDSIAYRYMPISKHRIRDVVRSNLRFLVLGMPIACLGGILFLRHSLGSPAPALSPILAGLIAVSGLNEYLFAVQRACGPVLGAVFAKELLWRLVFIGLLVGSLFVDPRDLSSKAIAALYLLSLIPSLLAFLRFFAARLRQPSPAPTTPLAVQFSQVASFLGITLITMGGIHLDTLILGLAHGPELGAFFSAQRVVQVLSFFSYSFGVVAAPAISIAFARGDIFEIERRSRQIAIIAGGCVLILGGLIMIEASDVMAIFNPAFRDDAFLLRILCISPIIVTFCGLHAWIPVLCGLEKEYLLGRAMLLFLFIVPKILVAMHGNIVAFSILIVAETGAIAFMGAIICAWREGIRVV